MQPIILSIAAIIPTYNRSAMLRECIDSILAQSIPIQEIIVVNDGSTDDTESVIKSYGERITCITKPNGGKASALNVALTYCKADYVWICDDDDIAVADGAKHLATALDADPTAGLAFGTFQIFTDDKDGRHFINPTYWPRNDEPNAIINFFEEMFTFQFAMMVRRSVYAEVGPFREDMIRSQDYEMTIRLLQHKKSTYIPEVIFYQRKHEGQRGAANNSFSAGVSEQKWLEYDQKIFASVKDNVPLEAFTPSFALQLATLFTNRAALVERACVFAKRGLWDDAIKDFTSASELCPFVPVTPQELKLAEVIIRTFPAWTILSQNSEWVAALRVCYRANKYGQCIIHAACRPIVWQAHSLLRNGEILTGIQRLRMLVAILGIRGACHRIISSLLD